MRATLALALLVPLVFAGCFSEVRGDPPRHACGSGNDLAQSVIAGTEATWAGRTFTATDDGVKVWVEAGSADAPDQWWGRNAKAWTVAAVRLGELPEVVEAQAGLVRYDQTHTTVRVGGSGQSVGGNPQMYAGYQIIGPIVLDEGQRILVVGAADTRVSALSLRLRWDGCGETGPIVWGVSEGFVAGWGDLNGPVLAQNAAAGALAYQASLERGATTGIVLAKPPPGGDPTGQNRAELTTSRGKATLTQLTFAVHDGGTVRYQVTHAGEAGREPLVAFVPIEFRAS
jgi:hypothetical protein